MARGIQTVVRDAVTKDLRLKGLALIIALLVVALVRGGQEMTTRVSVDVEVLRPGETADRVLMTDVPDVVKVRLRGSQPLVQNVGDEDVPAVTLDLRDAPEGRYDLGKAPFRIPPGLELVSVSPSTIDLRYEERVTKAVPVVPALTGDVAPRHHIKAPIPLTPSEVSISGPASAASLIAEVRTSPVVVTKLPPGQHERRARLESLPEQLHYVGGDQVTVTIFVEPDIAERVFPRVAIEVRGTDLLATAEPVSLTVRGPPSMLEAIDPDGVTVFAQLGPEAAEPGTFRANVQVEGLDEALDVTLRPSAVFVTVARTPPEEETGSPPVERGAPPGPAAAR